MHGADNSPKDIELTWKRGCTLDAPQSTIPPSGGTRLAHRHRYHLDVGTETIVYFDNPVSMSRFSHFRNPLQHVSFFGRCYNCKYAAHSQKYCPLRYCKMCKSYGHSEVVCWMRNDTASPSSRAAIAAAAVAEAAAAAAEIAAAAAEIAAAAADSAAEEAAAAAASGSTRMLLSPDPGECADGQIDCGV